MNNIDDFNRGVVLIMAALYEAFPRPVMLDIRKIDNHADLPEYQLKERKPQRQEIYKHTWLYLAEEGFIRHTGDNKPNDMCCNATLTSKGLAILNSVPACLHDHSAKTNGDTFFELSKEAVKGATSEGFKIVVNTLFTLASRGFTL